MSDDTDLGPLVMRFRLEETVQLLQDYPGLSNAEMMELMRAIGFDVKSAAEMVAYVPMAYLRVLMEPKGVVFPPTCIFYDGSGEVWEVNLDRQPMFQAAMEYAYYDTARGVPAERVQALILRSCELGAINDALKEGIPPDALELFSGQFNADGDETPLLKP